MYRDKALTYSIRSTPPAWSADHLIITCVFPLRHPAMHVSPFCHLAIHLLEPSTSPPIFNYTYYLPLTSQSQGFSVKNSPQPVCLAFFAPWCITLSSSVFMHILPNCLSLPKWSKPFFNVVIYASTIICSVHSYYLAFVSRPHLADPN